MRRTYISPEFDHRPIPGTLCMREQSSLFGSKMLEIEDHVLISDLNIVYYQTQSGEQLDKDLEILLPPISWSSTESKNLFHTLSVDNTRTGAMRSVNTSYILRIEMRKILNAFLHATLRSARTFEGVRTNNTTGRSVDAAINEYITLNVIDRYRLSGISLWINYLELSVGQGLRGGNAFAGQSDANGTRVALQPSQIMSDINLMKRSNMVTSPDGSIATIRFDQEKSPEKYCFDYYFNLNFTKI